MGLTNFRAEDFGSAQRKSSKKAGRPRRKGAEANQPEHALNGSAYYDEKSDSSIKFQAGSDTELGGTLVENPSDALNGAKSADVSQDLEGKITPNEDANQHVHATSDPMGNTEEANVKSASGVTAYRLDKKDKAAKADADLASSEAVNEGDSGDSVPDGTAKEILDWVGDDKSKAKQALDAENANDKPRKTVVGPLEELLS